MPPLEQPGKIGKYEILSVLGRGGMGVVYKARDPMIDRIVAVKTISAMAEGLEENQLQRLLMEARSAGRLHHPNIVTVFDFGEDNGVTYIVLEYAEGTDLAQVIAARQPLALPARIDILLQVCQGLGYAHDHGVTHRDIKPSNVRLTTGGVAKILDFGLARYDNTQLTKTGFISGTIAYMSPERLTGQAGPSDDIFALGAVAYELLTYQRAFLGASAPEVMLKIISQQPAPPSAVAEVPPALDALVLKCLAREPEQRYGTVHDFAHAVEEAASTAEVQQFITSGARSAEFKDALKHWSAPRRKRDTAARTADFSRSGPSMTSAATEVLRSGEAPTVITGGTPTAVHEVTGTAIATASEIPTVTPPTQLIAVPRGKRAVWTAAAIAAGVIVMIGAAILSLRPRTVVPHQQVPFKPVVRQAPPASTMVVTTSTETERVKIQKAWFELEQVSRQLQSKLEGARSAGVMVSQPRWDNLVGRLRGLQKDADAGADDLVRHEAAKILAEADTVIRQSRPLVKVAAPLVPRPEVTRTEPPGNHESKPTTTSAPASEPARDPRAEISAFMAKVAAAYQSRDAGFFRDNDLHYSEAMGNAIRNSPSTRVELNVESIDVPDANHARVAVQRVDEFGKDAPSAKQRLLYHLERQGAGWKISRFERR